VARRKDERSAGERGLRKRGGGGLTWSRWDSEMACFLRETAGSSTSDMSKSSSSSLASLSLLRLREASCSILR
jgi:hypothetical protein